MTVTGPFHIVRLAGRGLGNACRSVQRETAGRLCNSKSPIYKACPLLLTCTWLPDDHQRCRLGVVFPRAAQANSGHLVSLPQDHRGKTSIGQGLDASCWRHGPWRRVSDP